MFNCTFDQYVTFIFIGILLVYVIYMIILDYIHSQEHAEWRELMRLREQYTPTKTVVDHEQARLQQLEAQFRKKSP